MNKAFWKKFGENNYSKDKEWLSAIVTSDSMYSPKSKNEHLNRFFKVIMYTYAVLIFVVTVLSLAMLAFSDQYIKNHINLISGLEITIFIVLLVDIALRWYTSEVKLQKGNWSYFLFPFTFTGFFLIASLLPSMYLINSWTGSDVEFFKTMENLKFLRVFRIVLLANLVPGLDMFRRVLHKEKSTLYVVFGLVLVSIVLFALVMYSIESNAEVFDANGVKIDPKIQDFQDALYFSTITLTTIGFGDVTAITELGQTVTMIMSIIGIAVLATPSGIIAGGFISEVKERNEERAKAEKDGKSEAKKKKTILGIKKKK